MNFNIRDRSSDLYVGMRVVEMFSQYNRQGRKDKLYVNKMESPDPPEYKYVLCSAL